MPGEHAGAVREHTPLWQTPARREANGSPASQAHRNPLLWFWFCTSFLLRFEARCDSRPLILWKHETRSAASAYMKIFPLRRLRRRGRFA